MLIEFIEENKLDQNFINTANNYFIPLAESLVEKQKLHLDKVTANKHSSHSKESKTFFVGINGCQGSGKSTLVAFLAEYLKQNYQLSVAVLSLDDFYLSKAERNVLADSVHALFKTRGVPGTHDVTLLTKTLNDLKRNQKLNISLPRFNKAQDDPFPKKYWPEMQTPVDMVLFEGWCWGIPAQPSNDLILPVNSLESKQDQQLIWRSKVIEVLRTDYQPLYQLMDTWIMLKAPNFSCVYQWRLEQEHKLAQNLDGKGRDNVMSDEQVANFIQYYQRLTEYGIKVLPNNVELLFELDEQRRVIASRGL